MQNKIVVKKSQRVSIEFNHIDAKSFLNKSKYPRENNINYYNYPCSPYCATETPLLVSESAWKHTFAFKFQLLPGHAAALPLFPIPQASYLPAKTNTIWTEVFQAGEITDVPLTDHKHTQKQTRSTHTLKMPPDPRSTVQHSTSGRFNVSVYISGESDTLQMSRTAVNVIQQRPCSFTAHWFYTASSGH